MKQKKLLTCYLKIEEGPECLRYTGSSWRAHRQCLRQLNWQVALNIRTALWVW